MRWRKVKRTFRSDLVGPSSKSGGPEPLPGKKKPNLILDRKKKEKTGYRDKCSKGSKNSQEGKKNRRSGQSKGRGKLLFEEETGQRGKCKRTGRRRKDAANFRNWLRRNKI